MRALRQQEVKTGVRVALLTNVERYPHFIAPKLARGTITEATADLVLVTLDDKLPGAEEWDNAVAWTPEDGYHISRVPDARAAAFRDLARLDKSDHLKVDPTAEAAWWKSDRMRCPSCGSEDCGTWGETAEQTDDNVAVHAECEGCGWKSSRLVAEALAERYGDRARGDQLGHEIEIARGRAQALADMLDAMGRDHRRGVE